MTPRLSRYNVTLGAAVVVVAAVATLLNFARTGESGVLMVVIAIGLVVGVLNVALSGKLARRVWGRAGPPATEPPPSLSAASWLAFALVMLGLGVVVIVYSVFAPFRAAIGLPGILMGVGSGYIAVGIQLRRLEEREGMQIRIGSIWSGRPVLCPPPVP
ncbi:MAG: hypothetical protein QOE92_840 [Chloroflexota bacterium]|jgi:hypothetical protein|nr:hypothetical protein [Chloroflexota bacterium]